MKQVVTVPFLGEQKKTKTILNAWLVLDAQPVKEGEDLAELVTDKAAFSLPSPAKGRVVRRLVQEGAIVVEGQPLLELETF